jgi:formylmethanofuran dehydrogenase subunit E-like metal-binding protein
MKRIGAELYLMQDAFTSSSTTLDVILDTFRKHIMDGGGIYIYSEVIDTVTEKKITSPIETITTIDRLNECIKAGFRNLN